MPLYRIHLSSDDGAIDSPDPEGVTLAGIGEARALAVETLVEASRERVPAGRTRTLTVTVEDGHGAVVYRDAVVVRGPGPDAETAGVWRAMGAMRG